MHGGGNVYRDFDIPNPEVLQLKAKLAARIIKALDARQLTVRAAHDLTGFAAADFSRVRKAKLARFTIDRLMTMLGKLGQDVKVNVSVHPRGDNSAISEARAG